MLTLDEEGTRTSSSFTEAWQAAARGARASELPAYRWQAPNDSHLAGFLSGLDHWPWQDPPEHERVPAIHIPAVS